MSALLITGAAQLLTLRGRAPRRGAALSDLGIIKQGALLVRDGLIAATGSAAKLEALPEAQSAERLDVGGRVILPGFVDSHTHLVFPASRVEEYEMRVAGATYEQIAAKGGGILSTVRKLREATAGSLKLRALAALRQFAAHGTTTLEAKSGYGLDLAGEIKILALQKELASAQPLDIVSTFLGAHTVPAEFRRKTRGADLYISLLIGKILPEVARAGLAEFCDVFCDRGTFSVEQAQRVLEAGKALGLTPRLHAEQLARTGAAQLAIRLGAASCDHLEKISTADIRALAGSNTVATLLPGCTFHLGLTHHAPARELIDAGAVVALATDFNPGTSPTLSMPMILSLACARLGMSPAEAIAAATINAAYALHRHSRIGSLEVGKFADLAVFDVADYREIPYYFGVNHCWMTLKRGKIIFSRSDSRA